MNFNLLKPIVELVRQFMEENNGNASYGNDLQGFTEWVNAFRQEDSVSEEPHWLGKEMGRSSDSVINTLLVRMGRYAKSYSRSAMAGSGFSSQDDFIYLISLRSVGAMSKMELIRHNVQEKPAGMLIINRLIHKGWAEQTVSEQDKRIRHIRITEKGLSVLDQHMDEIRKASRAVIGNLTHSEQMLLIALLSKLDYFHYSLYCMNLQAMDLLDAAYKKLN
ncbi:MarR family winged helix-turn-helix transcriptional regulator [Chryseobacterium pennipullorum]|uniref:MarR family transcriptional regulator n=1 Tax=Chryseobacterium pennipullorum TaxID=2258963 RepID=A0A3D9B9I0_9FLAO|nr:MarR family winged helix-turn-helix transcriptional regulator [Chryseobacterium pennipullorum]REC50390.1 MarR family transcriptional regulator [Chryseobacterium pennipullorum]